MGWVAAEHGPVTATAFTAGVTVVPFLNGVDHGPCLRAVAPPITHRAVRTIMGAR